MLATLQQTEELLEIFRGRGSKYTYKKGEFIIRPGEVPSGVFYIESGLVKAYDITKYGEENLLIIRREGEVFPLIWAITGQERQVIYEAISPASVWEVSRQCFLDYLSTKPEALAPLLDMTLEMYRIHSERILNLEYRSVRERLISFLITMSNRFGKKTTEGLMINVPLRHQDIASSINASRETTTRELAALERKDLLTTSQSLIILKDLNTLHSYL
ncbi:MAG TPA: Crp/Fnr family transcriptional regulator [Candidatus Saccharimonadales bacterium]|nr:Crp/Fnr family transcriptional regulator [Candidatus Saccharimonadales bacterium]